MTDYRASKTTKSGLSALAMSALLVAGCGGGGSGSSGGDGSLSFDVTDAPVDDANKVVIQVEEVQVKPADGERIVFSFDNPKSFDLLQLRGSASAELIQDESVESGRYDWIRLIITDDVSESFVETSTGGTEALKVPSGQQSGLKLVSGFNVPEGGSADFTIDFDLRKGLVDRGSNGFILKPAHRLIDNTEVGTIAGTVDQNRASQDGCAPAVYVYDGSDVTPDDVDGNEPDPVTSAQPEMDSESGDYEFEVGFLSPDPYTVTWTCDADQDDPEQDDDLTYEGSPQNVTVEADTTKTVNLQAN